MLMGLLEGICVFDFMCVLVGLYCTMVLVELGVEVIKFEDLGVFDYMCMILLYVGDVSYYFFVVNCGKRSVVFDFKDPVGWCVGQVLVVTCDVVVENFCFGVMARFGFGYEDLRERNLGVIFCLFSGFG